MRSADLAKAAGQFDRALSEYALIVRLAHRYRETRLLAEAYRNQAVKARKTAEREEAFKNAQQRYVDYIKAVGESKAGEAVQRDFDMASGHLALADMIMSLWAVSDLNEYELSEFLSPQAELAPGLYLCIAKLRFLGEPDIHTARFRFAVAR